MNLVEIGSFLCGDPTHLRQDDVAKKRSNMKYWGLGSIGKVLKCGVFAMMIECE
jgi:hypothetical protein